MHRQIARCFCCCCLLCFWVFALFSYRPQSSMARLTSPHAMTSKSSRSRETTASRSWWVLIVHVIDHPVSFITAANEPYCLHSRSRLLPVYKQTPSGATLGVRFCHFSLWNPPLSVMMDATWLVISLREGWHHGSLNAGQLLPAALVSLNPCAPHPAPCVYLTSFTFAQWRSHLTTFLSVVTWLRPIAANIW